MAAAASLVDVAELDRLVLQMESGQMPLDQLLLFIAAGLLLNLTPGPDVLYVVSNALRGGARVGVVAALGITAGCFVHIFAAAVGVGALLATSATAFTVLKWVGAAYLVWMGVRMLFAKAAADGGGTFSDFMRVVFCVWLRAWLAA